MLQPYVTPTGLALLTGVHLAAFAVSILILAAPAKRPDGWRVVGPGGSHWLCLFGSWAFSGLVSWVWLCVGSARRDAAFQMNIAFWLAVAFGIAAIISGIYIVWLNSRALRWNAQTIRWNEGSRCVEQRMTDFDAFRFTRDGGAEMRFRDRQTLKIDLNCRNANELMAAMSEVVGTDLESDPSGA